MTWIIRVEILKLIAEAVNRRFSDVARRGKYRVVNRLTRLLSHAGQACQAEGSTKSKTTRTACALQIKDYFNGLLE